MATEKHYLDKDGLSYLKGKMDETYAAKSELETAKQELQTSIESKAESTHQHVATDITDASETWASKTHSHAIADVADLQTQLDALQTNIDAIPQAPIEVTVDTADWSEGEGVVSKAFTATGVNNTSNTAYVAGLKQGTEGDKAARETFGNIVRGVVTAENELTLYSLKVPTTQITLLLVPFSTKEPVAEVLGLLGGGVGSGGGGAVAGNDISTAVITLDHDSFVYDGEEHAPVIQKVMMGDVALVEKSDYYIIGNDKETTAGSYNVVIAGIIKYSGSASKSWSITRADPKLTLSAETATITGVMGTANSDITVTHAGDGAITFEVTPGSDGGNVTAALDGNKIKLTSVKAGTCTVKVKLAQGTNHSAAEKSIAVTVAKATGAISVAPTEITLQSDIGSTGDVALTVTGDGTITVTGGETYVTAAVSGRNKITLTTKAVTEEAQTLTVSLAASDNYTAANCTLKVTIKSSSIYGVSWDKTASTKLTRTDDAVGFTDPTPAIGTGSGSSPFDKCMPWSGMVEEEIGGNKLIKIPKFWYKWTGGTTLKLQISDSAEEGFSVSPAHMDRGDGKGERDFVYVGKYHCNDSFKSAAGTQPKVSTSIADFRTGVTKLGAGYYLWDYAMLWTIRMLYLVEFADWDSQKVIGFGCSKNSAKYNMGATDKMAYHTGCMGAKRDEYCDGVKYRGIEDLWGNVWDWVDGIRYSSKDVYVYTKPSEYSSITSQSGGTKVGTAVSGNCIQDWAIPTASNLGWALYPSKVVSDSTYTTYVADGFSCSSVVCCAGGYYSQGRDYGLFYSSSNSVANTHSYIGARLQYLPQ